MKKKIIWGIILLIIIVPQLIPVDKPEIDGDKSNDLITHNEIPENIANMLKTSCYDCHSNQTVYPWYSYVAPISWLVIRDVKVGRKELNFSNWESLSKMEKAKVLDDISEEVEEAEMPMPIYFITHSNAKLSDADREALVNWSGKFAESLFE
ncbi:MAG: cytochrome C [Bacteroidetes bacterium]|nr:MAG: cytochrome C [Bacteroidota bacterium]